MGVFRRKPSRNISAIEAEVDYVVQRSPFLLAAEKKQQQQSTSSCVPCASSAVVPTFLRKELEIGTLLGTGSFSKVYDIVGYNGITSKKKKRNQKKLQQEQEDRTRTLRHSTSLPTASSASESSSLSASSLPHDDDAENQQPHHHHHRSCTDDSGVSANNSILLEEQRRLALTHSALDNRGNPRYAVKFVRKELSKKEHAFRNAAADLIVEAKYLGALNHPNILKLRGVAKGGCASFKDSHEGFFMIVDRLQETLQDRIEQWQRQEPSMDLTSKQDLLALCSDYSLQIADALAYLHDRRILFRDLKPTNVGFQATDPHTIQLFDFGLCRELPADSSDLAQNKEEDRDTDDDAFFQMSGAGTYLYMAVEIFNTKVYNLKADVYSWAFLFHEMIALKRPFDHYSMSEHKEFVCEIGQRPSLTDYNLPKEMQSLLRQAWEQDPTERLTMRQVCHKLEPIVQDLRKQQQERYHQQVELGTLSLPDGIPPPYEGWKGSIKGVPSEALLDAVSSEAVDHILAHFSAPL